MLKTKYNKGLGDKTNLGRFILYNNTTYLISIGFRVSKERRNSGTNALDFFTVADMTPGINKLECLSLTHFFWASQVPRSGILLENIRLATKKLPRSSTLAYVSAVSVTKKKVL